MNIGQGGGRAGRRKEISVEEKSGKEVNSGNLHILVGYIEDLGPLFGKRFIKVTGRI